MYRVIEFVMALILLIISAPVLLLVSLLIYICMGRPILFRQQRPGLNAKPFIIYKFRTMTLSTKSAIDELGETARITGLGKWLRRLSLDELPQLFNILKGDLGFIGPRPLLMEHLALYNEEQARRHLVKPGVTGWAQVNGRNSISWEDKLKLDVWYVDNKSWLLNLKILFMTVLVVLGSKGIEYHAHTSGFKK